MIALDSNIFIYHLEENPHFGTAAKELLTAVERGRLLAVTSELTLTEVMGFPGMTEDQAALAHREMLKTNTKFVKITAPVLLAAAELRRRYGLRTQDAVHVATAIVAGASHFVSNDLALLKKKLPEIMLLGLDSAKEILL